MTKLYHTAIGAVLSCCVTAGDSWAQAVSQTEVITVANVKVNKGWNVWHSEHWPFGIAWKPPLKIVSGGGYDTKDVTRLTLVDHERNAEAVVSVGPNTSVEPVSDETFGDAIKQGYQAQGHEFLAEDQYRLADVDWRRFRFAMRGGSKGPATGWTLVHRDAEKVVMLMLVQLDAAEKDPETGLTPSLARIRFKLTN